MSTKDYAVCGSCGGVVGESCTCSPKASPKTLNALLCWRLEEIQERVNACSWEDFCAGANALKTLKILLEKHAPSCLLQRASSARPLPELKTVPESTCLFNDRVTALQAVQDAIRLHVPDDDFEEAITLLGIVIKVLQNNILPARS